MAAALDWFLTLHSCAIALEHLSHRDTLANDGEKQPSLIEG
jgi:hypothetical protein